MRVLGFKYLDLYWQTREYKLVLLLAINFFLIHYEMGVVEKKGLVFFFISLVDNSIIEGERGFQF